MNLFFNAIKDEWKFLLKNKAYAFLMIAWPFLLALILGGIYSQKIATQFPIVVLDDDHSSLSRTLTRYLSSTRSFKLSNDEFKVESIDDLKTLIATEKVAAAVYIPANFSRDIKRSHQPSVVAYVTGSNLMIANMAIADLKNVVGTVSTGVRVKYMRKIGFQNQMAYEEAYPVVVDITRLNNPALNYANFLIPGFFGAILQQILVLAGALLFMRRKKEALLELGSRDYRGRLTLYFLLSLVIVEIYFRIIFAFFDIDIKGHISSMVFFSSFFTLACLLLGNLVAASSKTTLDALKAALLITSPAFIISGHVWPLREMPAVIVGFARMIPLTPYLEGLRQMTGAGKSLLDLKIEILSLLLINIVVLLILIFKIRKIKMRECA